LGHGVGGGVEHDQHSAQQGVDVRPDGVVESHGEDAGVSFGPLFGKDSGVEAEAGEVVG
jgi:hypothetical protein